VVLDGRGQIDVSGFVVPGSGVQRRSGPPFGLGVDTTDAFSFTLAIVGGTGEFANAEGSMRISLRGHKAFYRFDLT
jgi:hypothetical protein